MLSFLPGHSRPGVPAWWTGELPAGQLVELEMYGERMSGRLMDAEGDTLRLIVPAAEQASGFRLSTASGTAVISLPGGAVRVPVSCWASGNVVRLQVVGSVEFLQRRLHPRVDIRLPITLGWLLPGDRIWHHAHSHTVDISLGGLRIAPATTVWPGIGVQVNVMLELPDKPCQLQAQVVGTAPDYGLRLSFTDLSPDTVERVKRLTGL